MANDAVLQFATMLAAVKLERSVQPPELKDESSHCGEPASAKQESEETLTDDDKEFHYDLQHNLSKFRERLIRLLEARRLVCLHLSPQMAYDLENMPVDTPLVWIASDGFRLDEVLAEFGITAFEKNESLSRSHKLTKEAREWITRAYDIQQCEKRIKENWLSEDSLTIDMLRNYDSVEHQIERFLENKVNAPDWARVAQRLPTRDEETMMSEPLSEEDTSASSIGDAISAGVSSERRASSQEIKESMLEEIREDPRYVLQLERGRTNMMLYGSAPRGAHGPRSTAGQDQFELRENLEDYDDDIYSYLLLRRELAQCSAALEQSKIVNNQQEHKKLILSWREKLMVRGLYFGIEIFRPAASGNGYEITDDGMEFADLAVKAFAHEEKRGIGHTMEDYEARRTLFLADTANAPEWANLIALRQHRLSEESRIKTIRTMNDLQRHDDLVKLAFLSATAQQDPYLPSFWHVLQHIEETSTAPYYDKLVIEFRTKLAKLADILSLYDVRTKQALGLSSDTHKRQPYAPEYLPIQDAVVVGDTRLSMLIEAPSGLETPSHYVQTAPKHLLEHTLDVLSNPSMLIDNIRRFDVPKWASEFWQVATPPMAPYRRRAPSSDTAPSRTPAAVMAAGKRTQKQPRQRIVDVVVEPSVNNTNIVTQPEPAPEKRPTTTEGWSRIIDYSLPYITIDHQIALESAHSKLSRGLVNYLLDAINDGALVTPIDAEVMNTYQDFTNNIPAFSRNHGNKTNAKLYVQLLAQKALAPIARANAEAMLIEFHNLAGIYQYF